MSKPIIEVSGLSKQYHIGTKLPYKTLRDTLMSAITSPARLFKKNWENKNNTIWALKDISFEVQEGEILGIIGRNGAGKTTLLKILSRVTEPTKGEVKLRGRVASLLEVGTGFHPELTGRENIFLNGAILGMTRQEIKAKFDEIVAFAEIEKFIDTPVKRYSSGMYVRLAFAVAAHLEPEILFVDEVLAVGDINFQQKCINKMGDVAKEGRTVLIVSHNMRVVETLTERCLYLRNGSLGSLGSTLEVVKQYQRESLNHMFVDELPSEFDVEIKNPKIRLGNFTLSNGITFQQTSTIETERPMQLSFDIEAEEDILEAVVCVYFCKDRIIISGNNSDHMMGHLSLKRGERIRFNIKYESVAFIPGNYTVLIFVLPSYFSRPTDSLTELYTNKIVVEGSRKHGGGYTCLKQSWEITTDN
jgi:lipopolysaccharide transport system ATP-binding protein